MLPLYDAHNHAHDDWLAPHRERIDADLRAAGLRRAVVNGTCEADWPAVADLAARHAWVFPSYGLHPWDAGNRAEGWFDRLKERLAAEPHAAVGEIGLDRWILDSAKPDDPRLAGLRRAPLEEQGEVFIKQLSLAAAENRPVTIHCLQAFGALEGLLRHVNTPARGFLLHAYGGPAELVGKFADYGAYFSFNGAFLDARHSAKREVFRRIPADRLLVETDAPAMPLPAGRATFHLPPAPDGSTVNHPANLAAAYAGLAELREVSLDALAAQVETNFRRFFGD
ncbi:MAG: TatD family hydrolase [Candidatus Didemnitutus sp.]|nr:TatD family hydrolase [Candidatus Didemnitutus sp.]